jgi:hypothetical protein
MLIVFVSHSLVLDSLVVVETQHWARSRSLLPPPYVHIFGQVVEKMVLSKE